MLKAGKIRNIAVLDKIVSEQDKSIPPEKKTEQDTQQDEIEEDSEYVIIAEVWWTERVNLLVRLFVLLKIVNRVIKDNVYKGITGK